MLKVYFCKSIIPKIVHFLIYFKLTIDYGIGTGNIIFYILTKLYP